MKYSKEEILEFVDELKRTHRYPEYDFSGNVRWELSLPNLQQVKAAQIIEQLLSRKCSGKCKS